MRRDSKNKVLSSVYARTRVRNHRECTYLFQHTYACVCVHSRRIYSLWHVRVLQPLKTYQSSATELASTLYACTITVIPRLARSYRTAQSFGRCDRRWAAGFIGFPREMNFARSIVPNYAPCLATNYALPFISSSFVSFFSFFITVLTR